MFIKHNSYTGAPRAEDLKSALSVIQVTHHERMRKIDSLRQEIQGLLDHITNLKVAEDKYLAGLGLGVVSPIGDDGSPTRNPFSTLPDRGINSRADSSSRLKNSAFSDYSDPDNPPKVRPGQQDVNIAMNKALSVLINEDKTARRYAHKILNANLIANIKRNELQDLIKEQEAVAAGQGRDDG